MMEPKITALTIERYRMFRRLHIDGLGRVNLLAGRNNTGKSSVLEAIKFLISGATPTTLFRALRFREADGGVGEVPVLAKDEETSFPWSSLFYGFPRLSKEIKTIEIDSRGGDRPRSFSMGVGWFSETTNAKGEKSRVQVKDVTYQDNAQPMLTVVEYDISRIISLDYYYRSTFQGRSFLPEGKEGSRCPCELVDAYENESTVALGRKWDKIALSDMETDVIEALKIIDGDIKAVSMIEGAWPNRSRTAIVRSAGLDRPVPLRSFGDGLTRLLNISLSLVNAKGGLLLIDEFENGLHHTVQTDIWRVIFKLARRLDIQVVATTHSWDAIEAFQKVVSTCDEPEDGVLVRLTRKGEDIIPTVFSKEDLAIATRDRIEVR